MRKYPGLVKGEKNPAAKLTEEKVARIKRLYSEGKTLTELGKAYGVTLQNIWLIVNKKKWAYVEPEPAQILS